MPIKFFLLGLAAVSNIFAVYLAKASNGMTKPWETCGIVATIVLTQWCLARAMQNGANVGAAVAAVVVTVMFGAILVGPFFGERIGAYQIAGGVLAMAGIVVMNLPSATS